MHRTVLPFTAVLIAAAIAPAAASAQQPVAEGDVVRVQVRTTCVQKQCPARIATADRSATTADYVPDQRKAKLRKRQVRTLTLAIRTVPDAECEPNETFAIRRTVTGAPSVNRVITIVDDDCTSAPAPAPAPAPVQHQTQKPAPAPAAPAPAPATPPAPPAPAPTPPADTGTPETTTQTTGNLTTASCVTPFWTGTTTSPTTAFNPGCTIRLTCPQGTRTCEARAETVTNTEQHVGHQVRADQRLAVASASNTEFFSRPASCANLDWCRTEQDFIHARGGETVTVSCAAVRQIAPQANRSKVRCSLQLIAS